MGLEYSHKFNIMEDNWNIINKAEESMISAINHLEGELAKIRAGKANPIMLKNISVDYYGNQTPLNQVANVNTPNNQTISVQPWEKSLLDEIEKAHRDVTNILLQVMDNGFLTGSTGKKVDMRNVILIMTSNLGAEEMEKGGLGFTVSERKGDDDIAVKNFFPPEFRNRLDGVVKFNKLPKTILGKIVDKFIKDVNILIADKNIKNDFDEQFIEDVLDFVDNIKNNGRETTSGVKLIFRENSGKFIF